MRSLEVLKKSLAWRFQPTELACAGKPAHDPTLDALRGFAACSVFSCHLLAFHHAGDTSMNPPSEWLSYLHFSRIAVLLFFVLSGYVIGLNYHTRIDGKGSLEYARRRAVRLMPIYWIGLALGWCAVFEPNLLKFLGHLLFLQNAAGPVTISYGNYPVWSLHYEVVYYLAFLLILRSAPRVLPLGGALLILCCIGWFLKGVPSILGGWSTGACFWLSGLCFAWQTRPSASPQPVVAPFLALYATNHLWPGLILFNGLGVSSSGNAGVNLADLFFLPGCVTFFAAVTGRRFYGLSIIRFMAFAIPLGAVVLLLLMGRLGDSIPWKLSAAAIIAAVILIPFEQSSLFSRRLLSCFAPIGAISYALYLFHAPITALVGSLRQTDMVSYPTALLLICGFSFGLAWLAEKKLQPWITKRCRPAAAVADIRRLHADPSISDVTPSSMVKIASQGNS